MSSPIESVLKESRRFPPAGEFSSRAHIKSLADYEKLWQRGKDDPEGFWAEQAKRKLALVQPVGQGARMEARRIRSGLSAAQINASYNCLDRHLDGPARTRRPSSGKASRAIRAC